MRVRPLDTLMICALGRCAVLGRTLPLPGVDGYISPGDQGSTLSCCSSETSAFLASWTPTLVLSEDTPEAFSFAFESFTLVAFLKHPDTCLSVFFSSEADGKLQ